MREKILALLKEAQPQYLSGAKIATICHISRAAVWKHIKILRSQGYPIISKTNYGYALLPLPLPFNKDLFLKNNSVLIGSKLILLPSITSTNDFIKQNLTSTTPSGTVVLSEEQTNGRGRLARGWFSPPQSGLWFSIILRPSFSPLEAPKCTLMSAVAITKTLRKLYSVPVAIKWPNDILCSGKKLVGILTEINAEIDKINYLIIGIGINTNVAIFPEDLSTKACSLHTLTDKPINREELLIAICEELSSLYLQAEKNGFTAILKEWRQLSCTLGKEVQAKSGTQTITGIAENIDEFGALIIKTETGLHHFLAGDISLHTTY